MVNVYAVPVPDHLPQEMYERLLNRVCFQKRQQACRFRRREDSLRTVLGDVLVRQIVCRTFQIENDRIAFRRNRFGKPFLPDFPRFHFNLSHSGKWVVCATSHSRIGIDIEKVESIDLDIAKQFFSNAEYEDLANKPDEEKRASFYEIWTLKESYIKAVGMGLSLPLQSFAVKTSGSGDIGLYHGLKQVRSWHFRQYDIDVGYKLAVCSADSRLSGEIAFLDAADLA
ncbi:4'-phosphopantetheinyl transferase family protein [Brevibacillus sp. TJ4]|uniref:4'-phosphopantetheinyl transferase family protein n=1 Tax=Brevibacillus sp. TJ4 TaxID=3234853 RepID=UPI003BA153BF